MSEESPLNPVNGVSPCIGVCALNEAEICLGCGRSLQDIAEWSGASEERRQQINQLAHARHVELEKL